MANSDWSDRAFPPWGAIAARVLLEEGHRDDKTKYGPHLTLKQEEDFKGSP